jgi:asparagine synthase (glutamine-hydrolysing)
MLNELFHESVPVILHEDDMNAMACSIENRSPFLDRALFEHACRIPTRHLVHDGYAKSVLRDAVRGIAPAHVLDQRRKTGFNASIEELIDLKSPAVRDWILEESPIWEHVRRERIAGLIDENGLPNSRSKFLFSFVNAKVFLEQCTAPAEALFS